MTILLIFWQNNMDSIKNRAFDAKISFFYQLNILQAMLLILNLMLFNLDIYQMLKKITISIASLHSRGRHFVLYNKILNSFSSNSANQVYKPLVPLTQQYNPIYVHTTYAQGKTMKPSSIFLYWLPAGLIFVNNYLTQWNIWNTLLFGSFLVGSMIARTLSRNVQGLIVHCLQIDPEIKNLYLTVPSSISNYSVSKIYGMNANEIDDACNDYHPLKEKNPDFIIRNNFQAFIRTSNPKINLYNQLLRVEQATQRFKVPIRNVKFTMKIKENAFPQFQRDLQRLSQKQMFKKYQNQNIELLIRIINPNPSQPGKTIINQDSPIPFQGNERFPYQIMASQNSNKKYHDYLLALALGYKIDTTDNVVIHKEPVSESQREVPKPEKQNQTQNNQQKKDENVKK